MKASIHPQYYEAKVTCSCGNTFVTGSTKPEIKVDICAACHPFFTGEMKFVDTLGRVEKFQQKQKAVAGTLAVSKKKKRLIKKQLEEAAEAAKPRTIREMIEKAKKQAGN